MRDCFYKREESAILRSGFGKNYLNEPNLYSQSMKSTRRKGGGRAVIARE